MLIQANPPTHLTATFPPFLYTLILTHPKPNVKPRIQKNQNILKQSVKLFYHGFD